ncbi:hypothetical protein HGM15179_003739 [Zosterops borbonicus]|uniref:Uncharacterized protein n=1 Tax=Zosterops borbonicus TaxID=364589 RepID=A0A8K1LRT6_9PASS|nr:hypothetical protein HGM15179_003739 [Zosterops borbonicus]
MLKDLAEAKEDDHPIQEAPLSPTDVYGKKRRYTANSKGAEVSQTCFRHQRLHKSIEDYGLHYRNFSLHYTRQKSD